MSIDYEDDDMEVIPQDKLFIITKEADKSHVVPTIYRAKKDINIKELLSEWIRIYPEQMNRYEFWTENFALWCYELGLLEVMTCYEWHIDGIHTWLSEVIFVPFRGVESKID